MKPYRELPKKIEDKLRLIFETDNDKNRQKLEDLLIGGLNINRPFKNSKTPLMDAANWGHCYYVERLITAGARLLDQDNEGNTALHWATLNHPNSYRGPSLKTLKALIDQGADINHTNKDDKTPLLLAFQIEINRKGSYAQTVLDLLNLGASLDAGSLVDGTSNLQLLSEQQDQFSDQILEAINKIKSNRDHQTLAQDTPTVIASLKKLRL